MGQDVGHVQDDPSEEVEEDGDEESTLLCTNPNLNRKYIYTEIFLKCLHLLDILPTSAIKLVTRPMEPTTSR